MVNGDIDKSFIRFDVHEDQRTKIEVAALKEIRDRLDMMNEVLVDISESLKKIAVSSEEDEKEVYRACLRQI